MGGKFTEGLAFSYVGGTCIHSGWYECTGMSYSDSSNKLKIEGYGKVRKIDYNKPRRHWDFQTLVFNDDKVINMWKEGNDFGFLKIVVELKEESDSECHKNELNEDGSTGHDSNPMHDSETDIVIKCEPSLNYSSEDEEFISGSMID